MVLATAVANVDATHNSSTMGSSLPTVTALAPADPSSVVVPAVSVRRSRWVRRPWYRRPRIVVPVILLTLGFFAIAAIAHNIRQTFTTINQVSTPASGVSAAALGGDDSITIDTGPAQAAIAAANQTEAANANETSSATATTEPTETIVATEPVPTSAPAGETAAATDQGLLPPPPSSEVTEASTDDVPTEEAGVTTTEFDAVSTNATSERTNVPEATVAPTEIANSATVAPEATATPEPTSEPELTETEPTVAPSPTPIVSEIERIKNSDFESGNTEWYLEAGAAIAETDAVSGANALVIPASGSWVDQSFFFLVGTTYQLTAWGKVTEKGEAGEIGVTYHDENGQRLTALEPDHLSFKSTSYKQQSLRFTVPDEVANVKIYIWKGKGKAEFNVDDVSVRSEVEPSDLEPAKAAADDEAITILVMGVDARPGEAIDIGVRPDSLMVLRLDPETGSCRTLAIPRDTRTELPGYGQSKINHALAVGGIPYQEQVVENLLGLKIDHYVLIDFNGFQDLVDAVGGVQIDVTDPFTIDQDIWFAAGSQTLDGKHALAYARWRGGSDGDFGRINRQQQVLRALIRKGAGLDVVRSLNDLLPAVKSNIRTDLGATEMARIGIDYRKTCTDQSVDMLRLEGYDAWYDDPLLNLQLIYIVIDEAEISSKVRMFVEQ